MQTFVELPGWTFDVMEVPGGGCKGEGRHVSGMSISLTSIDCEEVLGRLRDDAVKMSQEVYGPAYGKATRRE